MASPDAYTEIVDRLEAAEGNPTELTRLLFLINGGDGSVDPHLFLTKRGRLLSAKRLHERIVQQLRSMWPVAGLLLPTVLRTARASLETFPKQPRNRPPKGLFSDYFTSAMQLRE